MKSPVGRMRDDATIASALASPFIVDVVDDDVDVDGTE